MKNKKAKKKISNPKYINGDLVAFKNMNCHIIGKVLYTEYNFISSQWTYKLEGVERMHYEYNCVGFVTREKSYEPKKKTMLEKFFDFGQILWVLLVMVLVGSIILRWLQNML